MANVSVDWPRSIGTGGHARGAWTTFSFITLRGVVSCYVYFFLGFFVMCKHPLLPNWGHWPSSTGHSRDRNNPLSAQWAATCGEKPCYLFYCNSQNYMGVRTTGEVAPLVKGGGEGHGQKECVWLT